MRGSSKERQVSLKFKNKTAVLVSPLLLRRIGAGQVDFCFVEGALLSLVEVKSSMTGVQAFHRFQRSSQRNRLLKSGRFLSELTGLSARILLA